MKLVPINEWREKVKEEGNATLSMEFEPCTSTVEAPLDTTVQMENANGGDWQEEIYEKIKSMKEMYFLKLSDLSQKIACDVQKNFLYQHRTNEQIEKLEIFKVALERILRFLRLHKHDIQLSHKEKLLLVEKHINFFLNPDQLREPTSSLLQEQLPQSSMQFQQPQSLDGQTNPPMQPVQGSMEAPLDSTSQAGNTNGADWQETHLVITGSLQQRPVNSPQQVNINSPQQVNISLHSGMNPVQANHGTLQQNSSTRQQSLPVQHEQQLLQIQQLRQQYHHRQMQQRLFQRRELRRHQQMLQNHQLRQLYHHQQMQQQLFQRQQSRRHQQMLQNQQLRRQYHHQQMRQQVLQRRQLMQQQQARQQQTTLLPTHQMSQLQQSSMQLQQPQSPDGRN